MTSPASSTPKKTNPGNQTGSWYRNMKNAQGWTTCVFEVVCAYLYSSLFMYGASVVTCGATVK